MGRPRKTLTEEVRDFKEQQMEVPLADTEVDSIGNKVEEKPKPIYTRAALGIFQNSHGQYQVIEIPFNDEGEVGEIKIISQADGLDVARERFRIEAASKIL